MHLFLTGERGVGKSTVLMKTAEGLDVPAGGFFTGYDPDRVRLCLWRAWERPVWDEEHTLADMRDGRPTLRPGAFDRLGPAALEGSRPWARLLLMDELGWIEGEERAFQRAVLRRLDGDVPVLGVLKQDRAGTWLEAVAAHPGVTLHRVTEGNRDRLPGELIKRLNTCRSKKRADVDDENGYAAGKGL